MAVPEDEPARLAETATFALIGLGRLLDAELEAALAGEGVTLRHLGALGHLRAHPGLSVSDLARRAGVTVQSMHSTVAQLRRRGAVDPGAAGGRGRTVHLTITGEGLRLLEAGRVAAAELDRTVLSDLPADAREALRRLVAGLLARRRDRADGA